jgi:hypothetical protein
VNFKLLTTTINIDTATMPAKKQTGAAAKKQVAKTYDFPCSSKS